MKKEMPYTIYKITFQDGFAYVGLTKYDIQDRIRRHIARPNNAELSVRLSIGDPYETEIMHEGISDISEAYQLETEAIRQLQKPINISGANPDRTVDFEQQMTAKNARSTKSQSGRRKYRKRHVFPPRGGNYTCSKCRKKKPHTDFHRDRTRFNGLHSKCKDCKNRSIWERKRKNEDDTDRFYEFLAKENGLFVNVAPKGTAKFAENEQERKEMLSHSDVRRFLLN